MEDVLYYRMSYIFTKNLNKQFPTEQHFAKWQFRVKNLNFTPFKLINVNGRRKYIFIMRKKYESIWIITNLNTINCELEFVLILLLSSIENVWFSFSNSQVKYFYFAWPCLLWSLLKYTRTKKINNISFLKR